MPSTFPPLTSQCRSLTVRCNTSLAADRMPVGFTGPCPTLSAKTIHCTSALLEKSKFGYAIFSKKNYSGNFSRIEASHCQEEALWHTVPVDFDEVYERFRRPVWRLSRRFTQSDEEALDTTQEVFLRVWRGLPGFRGEAKLSTWVFQIAWNHLRAHRRKMGRQPFTVGEGLNDDRDLVDVAPDPQPDPERRAASVEMLDLVEAALRDLPEHYQIVVWLRDGEDLSYEEIAHVLDVPIGTVRSRLSRARASLRQAVGW